MTDTRTLLELVDVYAQRIGAHDMCAGDTRDEIARRLELINCYRGTEASNIKAILRAGRPLDGWISEPSQYPAGTPEHTAYAAELKTELTKFAKGEEPYPYHPSDRGPLKSCPACRSTDPAVRLNPGGFICDDPSRFHELSSR